MFGIYNEVPVRFVDHIVLCSSILQSGSERASRSRLGSTSSMVSDGNNDLKSSDSTENGDHIDYKALYEAAK